MNEDVKRTQFNEMQYWKKQTDKCHQTAEKEQAVLKVKLVRQYSFPASRCNKTIHFRLCPLPPSLHFSIPDPWSRRIAAKWGYRLSLSAPRAFAREMKRKSPFDKKLWLWFCNIPWIFCRSCALSQSAEEKRNSNEWRKGEKEETKENYAKQLRSQSEVGFLSPLLLQQFQMFYTHASWHCDWHWKKLRYTVFKSKNEQWWGQNPAADVVATDATSKQVIQQFLCYSPSHNNTTNMVAVCVSGPRTVKPAPANGKELCVHPCDPPMFPLMS